MYTVPKKYFLSWSFDVICREVWNRVTPVSYLNVGDENKYESLEQVLD